MTPRPGRRAKLRHWLSVAAVSGVVLALTAFLFLESRRSNELSLKLQTEAEADLVAMRFRLFMDPLRACLDSFVDLYRSSDLVTDEEFARLAILKLDRFDALAAIACTDLRFSILSAEPARSALTKVLASGTPGIRAAGERAISDVDSTCTEFFSLDDETEAVVLVAGAGNEDRKEVLVWTMIDLAKARIALSDSSHEQTWRIRFTEPDGKPFITNATSDAVADPVAHRIVPFLNQSLLLEVAPLAAALPKLQTDSPNRILIIGFLAALIAGIYTYLLIHRQQKLTEALASSEQLSDRLNDIQGRLTDLINGIDAVIWEAQGETRRFDFVSDYAAKLFGYPVESWLQDGNFWLNHVHHDDAERVQAAQKTLERGGPPTKIEYRMIDTAGEEIWVKEIVSALPGRQLHLRGVIIDITDRVKSEEAVRRTQKLESLGVLAGGIAHDFNNLLTAIIGHADLLSLHIPPNTEAADSLNIIITTGERLADLTAQMLAYSGKGKFIVGRINLNQLIKETMTLIRVSVPKNVEVEIELDLSIPEIEGDRSQIQQVILNLLTNAADAIGDNQGKIFVKTECWDATASSDPKLAVPPEKYALIHINDTGCGMDAETLGRIFEPFFTTKFTGRGLGLAALQGIVRSHKGHIDIESDEGVGTTFRIFFPGAAASAQHTQALPVERLHWRGHGRVLVIDDDAGPRHVVAEALKRTGLHVLQAEDGPSGLAAFETDPTGIDLVMLDLNMPGMSGVEVYHRLREIRPEVLVIVTSGYAVEAIEEKFGHHKPDGFLQKPFRATTLVELVRQVLEASNDPGP